MGRAPKGCAAPGCLEVAVRGKSRCPAHLPPAWVGSTGSRDLGNRAWRNTRAAVLTRDGHRCRIQHPDRCIGVASEVDHLRPRASFSPRQRDLANDPHNLLAVCRPCHSWKTGAYDSKGTPFDLARLPWLAG